MVEITLANLDTEAIDLNAIPRHVGLILDGNGRWASERGLERTQGHAAGEAALFETIEGARLIGVEWITAYTFSTENWNRSESEVKFLMFFNEDILIRRRDDLHAQNVQIHFAGLLDDPRVPDQNRVRMQDAIELTKENTGLNVVFAFNHGGRADLVRAMQTLAREVAAGELDSADITYELIQSHLAVPGMPDCDLIIRTSGEQRLSNFLLWQAAYAEFLFPETLWPDFGAQDLVDCIAEYQIKHRRFGKA